MPGSLATGLPVKAKKQITLAIQMICRPPSLCQCAECGGTTVTVRLGGTVTVTPVPGRTTCSGTGLLCHNSRIIGHAYDSFWLLRDLDTPPPGVGARFVVEWYYYHYCLPKSTEG
eukprot:251078-Rhodomonas_salina.1